MQALDVYSIKTIDEKTIDEILMKLNEIEIPVEYEQIVPQVGLKSLGVLGVFGIQATISAIALYKKFTKSIKYVATTESVINNPKFAVAKKVVNFITDSNKLELIVLPDEINSSNFASILKRFSVIFQQYSMHVSGMPSDLLSLISIVSLGQKWIFNVQKRKFIII